MFEKYHLFRREYEDRNIQLSEIEQWEVTDNATDAVHTIINLHGKAFSSPIHVTSKYASDNFYKMISFLYCIGDKKFRTCHAELNFHMILYTISGEGKLEYEGRTYTLGPGSGVWIDRKRNHSFETVSGQWEHIQIYFSGSHAEYIYNKFSSRGNGFYFEDKNIFIKESEKLLDFSENKIVNREILVSNQIERILLLILCSLENSQESKQELPENLFYLIRYMERHYMKNMTLDEISDFSNISKFYLCHLFKKHLGCSPNEYLSLLRIENAKNMLLTTNLSAAKIGLLVGFTNENYFYRVFRQKTGMTPGKFRKNTQE